MCNNFIKLQRYRQKPRSKFCNTVSFVCNIRSVWLDLINTFIHISLYALCVLLMLLYTIVYWLSFRYMSSYKSIGKQAILVEYILHQYGISVAESQRFLLAKHTKWREARINGCFCRIIPCQLISYTQRLEILAKAQLPHVNDFLPRVSKTFLELTRFLKFCR